MIVEVPDFCSSISSNLTQTYNAAWIGPPLTASEKKPVNGSGSGSGPEPPHPTSASAIAASRLREIPFLKSVIFFPEMTFFLNYNRQDGEQHALVA